MKKNYISIILIIVLLCTSGCGSLPFIGKEDKNTSDSQFHSGNTGGNLSNRGLFCEYNGTVYFANPYDKGSLCSMDPSEKNIKRISSSAPESINVDSERIYYTLAPQNGGSGLGYMRKNTGLFSCKHNGSNTINYTLDAVGILAVCGDSIYFQHYRKPNGTDMSKMSVKKSDPVTVAYNMASPASIDGGIMYYANDDKDHYLYMMDTRTDTSSLLYSHQMYSPVYFNGYIFYIDLESNYHLRRYNLSTGEDIEIVPARVDMFNVSDSFVYYQSDSSSPDAALRRVSLDGVGDELVSMGIYCDINITSSYVYFHPFGQDMPMYHQPVNGAINVTTFEPTLKK